MTGIDDGIGIEKPKTAKRGRKVGSRKGSKANGQKSTALRPRKTRPGRGTESLVNAVNSLVTDQSGEIASALVKKAKTGDVPSARLLVEIAQASTPPPNGYDPQIAALHLPDPEALAAEPEWQDPHLGSVWVGDHWEDPETAPQALARARSTH